MHGLPPEQWSANWEHLYDDVLSKYHHHHHHHFYRSTSMVCNSFENLRPGFRLYFERMPSGYKRTCMTSQVTRVIVLATSKTHGSRTQTRITSVQHRHPVCHLLRINDNSNEADCLTLRADLMARTFAERHRCT